MIHSSSLVVLCLLLSLHFYSYVHSPGYDSSSSSYYLYSTPTRAPSPLLLLLLLLSPPPPPPPRRRLQYTEPDRTVPCIQHCLVYQQHWSRNLWNKKLSLFEQPRNHICLTSWALSQTNPGYPDLELPISGLSFLDLAFCCCLCSKHNELSD